mmetsp:Transcript_4448/g.10313  ORF Transcript_4448/g.10313 Transcript_4448/m.10313 type:complete len:311 (+) Transcript_4448:88-1020(+)
MKRGGIAQNLGFMGSCHFGICVPSQRRLRVKESPIEHKDSAHDNQHVEAPPHVNCLVREDQHGGHGKHSTRHRQVGDPGKVPDAVERAIHDPEDAVEPQHHCRRDGEVCERLYHGSISGKNSADGVSEEPEAEGRNRGGHQSEPHRTPEGPSGTARMTTLHLRADQHLAGQLKPEEKVDQQQHCLVHTQVPCERCYAHPRHNFTGDEPCSERRKRPQGHCAVGNHQPSPGGPIYLIGVLRVPPPSEHPHHQPLGIRQEPRQLGLSTGPHNAPRCKCGDEARHGSGQSCSADAHVCPEDERRCQQSVHHGT